VNCQKDDVSNYSSSAEGKQEIVRSRCKESSENDSKVQKIIQEAVRQGAELGTRLGAQILQQAACAISLLCGFPS